MARKKLITDHTFYGLPYMPGCCQIVVSCGPYWEESRQTVFNHQPGKYFTKGKTQTVLTWKLSNYQRLCSQSAKDHAR